MKITEPDLEKSSEARLDYDHLKESPDKLDGDPVLRLAADLLTMKAAVTPPIAPAPMIQILTLIYLTLSGKTLSLPFFK